MRSKVPQYQVEHSRLVVSSLSQKMVNREVVLLQTGMESYKRKQPPLIAMLSCWVSGSHTIGFTLLFSSMYSRGFDKKVLPCCSDP